MRRSLPRMCCTLHWKKREREREREREKERESIEVNELLREIRFSSSLFHFLGQRYGEKIQESSAEKERENGWNTWSCVFIGTKSELSRTRAAILSALTPLFLLIKKSIRIFKKKLTRWRRNFFSFKHRAFGGVFRFFRVSDAKLNWSRTWP